MAERAEALAEKFEQTNNDVISMVESASDGQWKAICADEGWSVGVVAHHVAGVQAFGHKVWGNHRDQDGTAFDYRRQNHHRAG